MERMKNFVKHDVYRSFVLFHYTQDWSKYDYDSIITVNVQRKQWCMVSGISVYCGAKNLEHIC